MNYLDLFSGIGGFQQALIEANVKINYSAFSEIDKHATKLYESKFDSEKLGDIRSIEPVSGLLNGKKIDLITFGFPCQDLSVAGERKGFSGNRSSLFFEATRLIKELRPAYFVFENVKGFFSSNKGKDFVIALQEIADIGYDGQWQLVNTKWFLPQNRERIFFIGYLRGACFRQIFPIAENEKSCFARKEIKHVFKVKQWRRSYFREIKNKICPTLTANMGTGGNNVPFVDIDNAIRKLTPTECERLQGFPEGWTEGFSDNQRYKMLGNAISVPVAKTIFNRLYH